MEGGVVDTGFERSWYYMLSKITTAVETVMPEIVAELQAEAISRAPSYDEEEQLVNYGIEGVGSLNVRYKKRPSDDDRISFEKLGGELYIRDALLAPGVFEVIQSKSRTYINAGNIALLNDLTHFSWTNVQGQNRITHTSTFGLFSLFEYGSNLLGMGNVTPTFGSVLVPAPGVREKIMRKTVPAYTMISGINPKKFRQKIVDRIRTALGSTS